MFCGDIEPWIAEAFRQVDGLAEERQRALGETGKTARDLIHAVALRLEAFVTHLPDWSDTPTITA